MRELQFLSCAATEAAGEKRGPLRCGVVQAVRIITSSCTGCHTGMVRCMLHRRWLGMHTVVAVAGRILQFQDLCNVEVLRLLTSTTLQCRCLQIQAGLYKQESAAVADSNIGTQISQLKECLGGRPPSDHFPGREKWTAEFQALRSLQDDLQCRRTNYLQIDPLWSRSPIKIPGSRP